ncbi:hypothetical protein PSD17_01650 [Pseudonocardia sp. D17]|nr:hypothetical protein PSD17_01650 [Pseudonocardia sp. D17]
MDGPVPPAGAGPSRPVRVLVTGTEYTGGLAALRALRAAGYQPWAAITTRSGFGARSRAAAGVVEVCDPRTDAQTFARQLASAAAEIGAVAVLPGTEPALLALGRHRALFPCTVAVGAPPEIQTDIACDKSGLAARAERAGLAVPPTTLVKRSNGEVPAEMRFPAVVKPVRSELLTEGGLQRFEVVRVEDARALDSAVAGLPGQAALIQPYLAGPIRTVNGVAWNGAVLTTVHKLADRTWPVDCGVVSYARTVERDASLDQAVRRLLADLEWSGLFNLQFIDADDSTYLIDVNPRIYHSVGLAVRAGVNLPAIWTALLLGQQPAVPEYSVGVRFRAEEDFYSLWRMFRSGQRVTALRALLPRPHTTHAVFSITDPRPTIQLARRLANRAISAIRKNPGSVS